MPEETAVCAFISHASRTENFIAYVSPALTTCLRAARRTNEVEARVCTLANWQGVIFGTVYGHTALQTFQDTVITTADKALLPSTTNDWSILEEETLQILN